MTRVYSRYIIDEIRGGSIGFQLLCANCNWIKRFENGETTKVGRRPRIDTV